MNWVVLALALIVPDAASLMQTSAQTRALALVVALGEDTCVGKPVLSACAGLFVAVRDLLGSVGGSLSLTQAFLGVLPWGFY